MGRSRQKKLSEKEAEDAITQQLVQSGARESIKAKVKMECKKIVKEKGANNISVEDLVQDLVPRCTGMVSDDIKRDMIKDVKHFLEDQAEDD